MELKKQRVLVGFKRFPPSIAARAYATISVSVSALDFLTAFFSFQSSSVLLIILFDLSRDYWLRMIPLRGLRKHCSFDLMTIRNVRKTQHAGEFHWLLFWELTCIPLTHFRPVTENFVRRTIFSSPLKTCERDAFPTPLLLECLDSLLPCITDVFNNSLFLFVCFFHLSTSLL